MGLPNASAPWSERDLALLEVQDLAIEFSSKQGPLRAVDNVSFSVGAGEILGLVGESGSGKSVTCRALLRLLPSRQARIVEGAVWFDGQDLVSLPESEIRKLRGRAISMIFQNPSSHLDPVMTIGQQIAEPLFVHKGLSKAEAKNRAVELLRQVGIPDPTQQYDAYPHQFSGGMRQRAMIAAALSCQPKLLIADEPTTALDVTVQAQILRLLLDLRDQEGLTIILITHDLGVIAQTADSVAVMYAGRIVEQGPKSELLRRPMHPYSEALIRSQPELANPDEALPSIDGQPPSLTAPPPGCRFHPRCNLAVADCATGHFDLVPVAQGRLTACNRWQELRDAEGENP
jgi:peptide/nickel transport system ATP-binding protein